MSKRTKNISVIILATVLGFFSIDYYGIELNILNAKIWQTLSISFLYTAMIYFILVLCNGKNIERKYNSFFALMLIGVTLFGISYIV